VDVQVGPGASLGSQNFGFLAEHDEQLVRLGALAERYFTDDPTPASSSFANSPNCLHNPLPLGQHGTKLHRKV